MAKLKPATNQPSIANTPTVPRMSRPGLRRTPWRKTGPRLYRLDKEPERIGQGPGKAPPEFLSAQTTETEWQVYWAFAKLYGDPKDPRQPPYTGARDGSWQYQVYVQGPLGDDARNLDFVAIHDDRTSVGFRIQTERFHIIVDAFVQAEDFFLKTNIRGVSYIVDIYEQDFIGDPTGYAVCTVVANALRGIESPGPIRLGTARKVRP